LYEDINPAGYSITKEQQDSVVEEAMLVFCHNINVYTEEPIYLDSLKGGMNIVVGFGRRALTG